MSIEYWAKGDIPPGPIKATVVPDVKRLASIIKQHKKPIMMIGPEIHRLSELIGGDILSNLINISNSIKAEITVSDSKTVRELDSREFKNYVIAFPLEVVQKISSNNANYDLAILIGFHYYYGWLLLNYLKHYAYKHLNTMSIDPYPQPNATWTFPLLPLSIWYKNLCQLEGELKVVS
jgi:CO dehydrogenase/acetyl-CoA synthase complex epsilon subunit